MRDDVDDRGELFINALEINEDRIRGIFFRYLSER